MRRSALDVLACPKCLAPLEADDAAEVLLEGILRCTREGLTFPVQDGIAYLVRPEDDAHLRAFAEQYRRAWSAEGWGSSDPGYLLGLPFRDPTGRQSAKWRVKARSMRAFLALLHELRPTRVVDLGAGMGWLSHHMARQGYEVYAVDLLDDRALGLGAAATYHRHGPPFERIVGAMERPPLRDGAVDTVVCNASLHYASSLPAVTQEVSRILRPGGSLVVFNSPVHLDAESASRAARGFRERLRGRGAGEAVLSRYRHFTLDELTEAVGATVGPLGAYPFDPGRLFRWSRRLKGLALWMEFASFPILVARKSGTS